MGAYVDKGAVISRDGRYRYLLWRVWDTRRPTCCFVMLNPSTADGDVDDATIRRCVSFANRESSGALVVANLFAWRTSSPRVLVEAARRGRDVVGPLNARHVRLACDRSSKVILAWGGARLPDDVATARGVLAAWSRRTGEPLYCLGVTKHGAPKHPVRLAASTPLIVYAYPPKEGTKHVTAG